MGEKIRCQSCGMPVSAEFGNFGTEADGSQASEYCQFCYQNGGFTRIDMTVGEMVQASVDYMTANMGFSPEQASQMSNDIIPKLKRWNA